MEYGTSLAGQTLAQVEQTHQQALAALQEATRHVQAVQTLLPVLRQHVAQMEADAVK